MLDLNLEVGWDESTHKGGDPAAVKTVSGVILNQMDESVTSNSSIVNGDASSSADREEDSCSTRAVTLYFEILKGVGGEEEEEKEVVMTKEFFPVIGGNGNGWDYPHSEVQSSRNSIDISFQRWKQAGENLGGGVDAGGTPAMQQPSPPVKKSRRGPRSKSSQYRGVTFYRRTGRWESHIWDCGKQVYLGGFDTAHAAARVYDRAAIRFRGLDADINFTVGDYEDDIKQMANLTKEEVVQILRRQCPSFSRGGSRYQGPTLHKWEAPMDQLLGKRAYDKANKKWNERESTNNSGLHLYHMKPEASNRAHVKLNLDLGISPPVGDEERMSPLMFHHGSHGTLGESNSKMDPPFQFSKRGFDLLVPHTASPSPFISPMERKREKSVEKTRKAPMAPLLPKAASSGFSFSATASHPHPFINLTPHSLFDFPSHHHP